MKLRNPVSPTAFSVWAFNSYCIHGRPQGLSFSGVLTT